MKRAPELNQAMAALADATRAAGTLDAFNARNRAALTTHPLPAKFSETWKYTKLAALDNAYLAHVTPAAPMPEKVASFDTEPLVIVNGRLPATLPTWAGVELARLAPDADLALATTTFAYLNGATLQEGLRIRVPKDSRPDAIHHIVFHGTGSTPSHHNTRLVIELEEGSRFQLIEQYTGSGPVLCNAVTEVVVHPAAAFVHCRLQSEAHETLHIGQLAMRLERNSRIISHQFMQASTLKRNDVRVTLDGDGAELVMGGAFVTRGKTHVDNQICVEHHAEHCTSNMDYKGIAGDQGHAIFNGRILIVPGARRTNANLTNKNLLLSRDAEIDSKPELEIYNDDVMCSHGTTIGQIDPELRFYLQSRGIDAPTAQRMLSLGFIQEQINNLPFAALGAWIRMWLGRAVSEVA